MSSNVMDYGQTFQEFIINVMATNPDLFVRCQNIIEPKYFDQKFSKAVEFLKDYSYKNSTLPTLSEIKVKSGYEPQKIEDFTHFHYDAALQEIEDFCRHKALEYAVIESMDHVKTKKYGEIEELVKQAMMVSLQKDLGTNYFENPEERNKRLLTTQANIKTGWKDVDYKLFGGFGTGELEIFAAPSGGGKSLALQNIALNFSKNGLTGVYISLELKEELVAQRMDSMLVGKSKHDLVSSLSDASTEVQMKGKNMSPIWIKRMPETSTTVHDIRAYLRELQIKTNTKVDYICVDYLDLLGTPRADSSDVFHKDKYVSEELRALAADLDITACSASQLGRCLKLDTKVNVLNKGTIEIKDLEIGDKILSKNKTYNTVLAKTKPSFQKTYTITTKGGNKIVCSENHIFPSLEGEKNIRTGISVGTKLLVKKNIFSVLWGKLLSVIR